MTLARVRAGAMIWLVRGASAQSKVQMRPYPKVIWILLNNEVDRWKEIEKGGQDGRERSSTIHGSSGVPVLLLLPGFSGVGALESFFIHWVVADAVPITWVIYV